METIGARVINELYINHLFSVALTLHGGTESFTYPSGSPNHMLNNEIPKIHMKYEIKNKKVTNSIPFSNSLKEANLFISGKFDMFIGKSTETPDANALACKYK
jgi:hypothetical protein